MAYYNMAFTGDQNIDSVDDVEPPASGVNPSPITTSKQAKPSGCFTFIDFCPEYRRKPNSWFFQADYQTFSEVFHKINDWLSQNPKWEVRTAETLRYDLITGFGQSLPFYAGKRFKHNLRAIRLWLVPRLHQRNNVQRIGCINVVPRLKITNRDSQILTNINQMNDQNNKTQSSFLSSNPSYESLDEMLVRVNELMTNKPINGKILSVETVAIPVEFETWSVDTETSYWSDESNNNSTVYIIRIYFEYGTAYREKLEIIDFVPRVQIWDTPLAVPIYETFSKSSQWLRDQPPGLKFLSCTTVEVPIDFGFNVEFIKGNINLGNNCIESRKMFYPKNAKNESKVDVSPDKFSLKFLRMAVTRPQSSSPESHFPLNRDHVILNCKIFIPTKIPSQINSCEFESINASKRKMEAWLMTTGARILSAETNVISIPFSSSSIATSVDSCLKSNSNNVLGHYLTIYRIYLDGHYLEPPARLLPMSLSRDEEQNQSDSCALM